MTIAETTSQTRNNYTGNGSTTVFPFTFIVLEESNQALNRDYTIEVTLSENNVDTIQQEGVDYTVQLGENGLGTVTFTTAPTTTQTITFLSSIPRTQSTDYINIGTDKFPANSHEGTVDKLTLISREQDEAINRAILLPESSNLTGVNIPVSVANADKAIVVNSTGDNLDAKNLADIGTAPVTDFAKTLLDDNNASEARTTLGLVIGDVITTQGDLIKGSSSGEAERLPVGSNNQILQSNGTNPVWSNDIVINDLTVNDKLNTQPNSATISSGAIAYTGAYMVVDTEGGASSDTLDTISGGTAGDRLLLRGAAPGRNIIISDNTVNIQTNNNTNFTLEPLHGDSAEFYYDGNNWIQTARRLELDFRSSKSQNGYTYLPNGLIFQWGVAVNVGGNSTQAVTLPITYPNAIRMTQATAGTTSNINEPVYSYSQTTSSITVRNSSSTTVNIYWFTIGN
jgi:hypothetical protein